MQSSNASMRVMSHDALHFTARRSRWLARLVVVTRILLAIGFVPTGLVKLLGRRFTEIPASEGPIWSFFEAMYQTGAYWQFLGAARLGAGVLLLVPRTAALGALCFLPIMLNIFVLTLALEFTGTPLVTGLMLLAVVFLLLWDFPLWKGFFSAAPAVIPPKLANPAWRELERALLTAGTAAGLIVFSVLRGLLPSGFVLPALAVGATAALALGSVWLLQDRRDAPTIDPAV